MFQTLPVPVENEKSIYYYRLNINSYKTFLFILQKKLSFPIALIKIGLSNTLKITSRLLTSFVSFFSSNVLNSNHQWGCVSWPANIKFYQHTANSQHLIIIADNSFFLNKTIKLKITFKAQGVQAVFCLLRAFSDNIQNIFIIEYFR